MTESLKVKQLRRGRGLCWAVYRSGVLVGMVSSVYLPSGSGAAFEPAMFPGTVAIKAVAVRGDDAPGVVVAEARAKVRGRNAADKWARAWRRDNWAAIVAAF